MGIFYEKGEEVGEVERGKLGRRKGTLETTPPFKQRQVIW
jgi:hypothetical protein